MTSNRRTAATHGRLPRWIPPPAALDMVAELRGVGGISGVSRDGRPGRVQPHEEPRRQQPLPARPRRRARRCCSRRTSRPRSSAATSRPTARRCTWPPTGTATARPSRASASAPDGSPGPIEVVAARDDAELDEFALNHAGTEAALLWNVAGRNELAFVDLASGRSRPGPALPAEIVGGLTWSPDDTRAGAHRLRRGRAHRRLGPRPRAGRLPPDHVQPAPRRGPRRAGEAGAGDLPRARRPGAERLALPAAAA